MRTLSCCKFAILLLLGVSEAFADTDLDWRRKLQGKKTPTRVALHDGEWAMHALHNLTAWRSHLFVATERHIVSKGNNDKPPGWERFDLFQPFISCPPERPLRRVGPPSDGGKWLCEPASLRDPCTVISLGSNMDFRFEEAILAETPCKVVTLDCTVEGKVLSDRHSFRKLCVGSTAAAKRDNVYVTYGQLVSSLGLRELAILKIDVESFEFPLFAELREHSHALPEQIAVEVHWFEGTISDPTPELQSHWGRGDFGITDLALFFFHMANLGYGIVNQEVNEFCPACSEFTLLRVEAPVLPHTTSKMAAS